MKNTNLGCLEGKKEVINKCHPEFISGSSTHAVLQYSQQRLQPASKMLKRVQHDFMGKRAFTLIELLVVVLIIGILAAVALPQYNKAVEKARATQAITLLRSAYESAQRYQIDNNEWPTSFDELDIQIPWERGDKWRSNALDSRSNGEWTIDIVNDQWDRGILIGRISGPYAGAGFVMWNYFYLFSIPRNTLVCTESRTNSSPKFGKNTGDYCKKLFSGKTLTKNVDSIDQFSMP